MKKRKAERRGERGEGREITSVMSSFQTMVAHLWKEKKNSQGKADFGTRLHKGLFLGETYSLNLEA